MTRTALSTAGAPAAIGPYSQAIATDGLVFCSGQLGLDPATGELVEGVEAQADRAMKNLTAVLDAAGLTLADLLKTTIFLADIADFAAVNAVYGRYMPEPPPARSTVQVAALPKGGLVEIEAIARARRSLTVTPEERSHLVARYRAGYAVFAAVVDGATDVELDARPFEGEWTVREIVHHLADGELSSAVRIRRLVAEEQPAITGYDEGLYARRLYYDVRPIDASLEVVQAARAASATILDHLTDERVVTHRNALGDGRVRGRDMAARVRGAPVRPRRPGTRRPGRGQERWGMIHPAAGIGPSPVDTPDGRPQNRAPPDDDSSLSIAHRGSRSSIGCRPPALAPSCGD